MASTVFTRVDQWLKKYQSIPLQRDPTLCLVAQENSRAISAVTTPAHGTASFFRFLLLQHNIREAVVQAAVIRYQDFRQLKQKLQTFLAQRTSAEGFTHYGLGGSDATTPKVMTLILIRRRAIITDLEVRRGRAIDLCARLLAGKVPRCR